MHVKTADAPVKMTAPGAVARQQPGFGEAGDLGTLAAEHLTLAQGTDIAPLLVGLDDDMCHAPHWGYLLAGEVVVSYGAGGEETCRGGDLFYWPPVHSVRVTDDAEIVMFSPHQQHAEVLEHMIARMQGSTP